MVWSYHSLCCFQRRLYTNEHPHKYAMRRIYHNVHLFDKQRAKHFSKFKLIMFNYIGETLSGKCARFCLELLYWCMCPLCLQRYSSENFMHLIREALSTWVRWYIPKVYLYGMGHYTTALCDLILKYLPSYQEDLYVLMYIALIHF